MNGQVKLRKCRKIQGNKQGQLVKRIDGVNVSAAWFSSVDLDPDLNTVHTTAVSTPEPVLGVVSVLQPWRLVHEEAAIAAAQLAQHRQGLGEEGGGGTEE